MAFHQTFTDTTDLPQLLHSHEAAPQAGMHNAKIPTKGGLGANYGVFHGDKPGKKQIKINEGPGPAEFASREGVSGGPPADVDTGFNEKP